MNSKQLTTIFLVLAIFAMFAMCAYVEANRGYGRGYGGYGRGYGGGRHYGRGYGGYGRGGYGRGGRGGYYDPQYYNSYDSYDGSMYGGGGGGGGMNGYGGYGGYGGGGSGYGGSGSGYGGGSYNSYGGGGSYGGSFNGVWSANSLSDDTIGSSPRSGSGTETDVDEMTESVDSPTTTSTGGVAPIRDIWQLDSANTGDLATSSQAVGVGAGGRRAASSRHPRPGWSDFDGRAQLDSASGADGGRLEQGARRRTTLDNAQSQSQTRAGIADAPMSPSVPTSTTLAPPDFVIIGNSPTNDEAQIFK